MIPRQLKLTAAILLVAAVLGTIYFVRLRDRVRRMRQVGLTEEQARRAVTQPAITTPTDAQVNARLFWITAANPTALDEVDVQLPLSADPVQRSKQLLITLITAPPAPEQRTLPADAALIEFYLLSDGTAVADFSDALTTAMPSGILNEQLAVDSIVKTLAANVPAIRRLKILIHGQEAETLAGHVDLTEMFSVNLEPTPAPPASAQPSTAPPAKTPAGLTPSGPPGKLSR
jgi:hypothetical protein